MFTLKLLFFPILLFFLTFIVFTQTTSPTISSYGDSAELITAAYNLEAGHPPGYPLFVILGKIFTFLPIGSIALRVNLMVCFFGSLTSVLVFLLFRKLKLSSLSSLLASLVLAFSYSFWLYAITAEVFIINNFFAVLLMLLFLSWREEKLAGNRKTEVNLLYIISFIFGLSLTNHTSIVLILPGLIYLVWKTDKSVVLWRFPKLLLFFLLGLTPYLLVIISAYLPHYPNFGNVPGFQRFFAYLTRSDYGGLFSPGTVAVNKAGYWDTFFYFLSLFFGRFTPVLPFFAFYLILQNFYKKDFTSNFLIVLFLLCSIVFPMYALKGVDNTDLHVLGVVERFTQLGFIMLAVCGVTGFYKFSQKIGSGRKIFELSLFLLVLYLFFTNYPKVDKSHFYQQKDYALNILNQVEPNSIVFISDDLTSFSLLYFVNAEHVKPNVKLISSGFLGNKWYQRELKTKWPDLYDPNLQYEYDISRDIIKKHGKNQPVYFIMLDDPYPLGFDGNPSFFTPLGLLLKAEPKASKDQIIKGYDKDFWKRYNLSELQKNYNDPFAQLGKLNYSFRHKTNARIYLKIGCLECGKEEIRQGLQISPEDSDLQNMLNTAQISQLDERQKSADEYLRSALSMIQLGGFSHEINLHRAIYDLELGEKADPNNVKIHGTLAELYEYFGAFKQAIKEYELAAKLDSKEDWQKRADTVKQKAPKEDLI